MVATPEFRSSRISSSFDIRKVRDFEDLYENPNVAGPTGLVYIPKLDRFLALNADSTSTEVDAISSTEDRDTAKSFRLPTSITNSINTVFDSKFNRLLAIQNNNQLIEVKTDANGAVNPQTLNRINLKRDLGLSKPEGVSIDPNTGIVYVLNDDKTGAEIVQIVPDSQGSLENGTITRIAVASTVKNPRGIAFDPTSGRFQILSPSEQALYEITGTGEIAATRSIKGLGLRNPQALVFAPSGDQTDAASNLSLYVADSTRGGSGIVELSFTTAQSGSAATPLSLVQTVQTSQFSASSPDPSGIAYIPQSNTVMISDGEVDEIPALYTGKNLFQSSLTGTLQQTFTSSPLSNEATGVGYNAANKYLYISDDNADRIFQINPGVDGAYNTSDDFAFAMFSTRTFNSLDPEDVVYSSTTGNLFIVDGVNAEVYQVTTTGTLVSQFDTANLGILDPEGITFLPNGNLAIVGNPVNRIAEVTTSGSLIQLYDISAANPIKPAGLARGLTSNNSGQFSLYVVDRGIDNNDDPNENDGRMFEFSLGTAVTNQAPILDAGPNQTIALQGYLQGWVYDGLSGSSITTNWGFVSGPGSVTFGNGANLATTVTFSAPGDYVLSLSASDGLLSATDQISVRVLDPQNSLFVSTTASGTVGGVAYQDEDVLVLNQSTNTWSMYFDGSDMGMTALNMRDFHILADGTMLFAINSPNSLPGLGAVEANDVIRFVPLATGDTTEGRFEMYLDGSDVGLTTDGERLDGIAIAPDGRIIISTTGSVSVPGLTTAADEDLLAFSPTSLGSNTAGVWSMYFDGSDVDLNDSSEDVNGVWIDSSSRLLMTTEGAYNVPGSAGSGADLFRFTPVALGANTSGSYSSFWTASSGGLTTLVDGVTRIG